MVLNTIARPNLRVICDLANYVGPENASVDAQRRLWDKVGSWYGDKIVAVHFNGSELQARRHPLLHQPRGLLCGLQGRLRDAAHPAQPVLPVLREEAVPARAASDIAFMKSFF